MGTRGRITLAIASAAAIAGFIGASAANAGPPVRASVGPSGIAAPANTAASTVSPADTVTPLSSACTTLYVQHGYGHAYVCKSWYANGDGTYQGYLKGTTYHAGAPSDRTVEVDANLDGNKFQMDETFSTHTWGPTHYAGYRTVQLRVCLHRLNASSESFCSGWW
jgi:hypothetical protein